MQFYTPQPASPDSRVALAQHGFRYSRALAEFFIVLHKSKYGYDVSCSALQGCHSQGETEKEAIENIRDAIRSYLAALKKLKRREKLSAEPTPALRSAPQDYRTS